MAICADDARSAVVCGASVYISIVESSVCKRGGVSMGGGGDIDV